MEKVKFIKFRTKLSLETEEKTLRRNGPTCHRRDPRGQEQYNEAMKGGVGEARTFSGSPESAEPGADEAYIRNRKKNC